MELTMNITDKNEMTNLLFCRGKYSILWFIVAVYHSASNATAFKIPGKSLIKHTNSILNVNFDKKPLNQRYYRGFIANE